MAASVTGYSDATTSGSTTYYYRVFAYNVSGDSAASNMASVTTPAPTMTAPATPTSLTLPLLAPPSSTYHGSITLLRPDSASNGRLHLTS
ncbi:MAG: hypothetical protein Q7K41_06945 [Dehalococcoidales bacterium]|nr:hypothetical protein [Dehalococcoidales bacterium]